MILSDGKARQCFGSVGSFGKFFKPFCSLFSSYRVCSIYMACSIEYHFENVHLVATR